MRAIRCAVAAVLAAGIVTVVAAQPGGRQFGGGGQTDVNVLVLTNKALQEEIKITDAQKEKFKPVADKQTELNKKRGEMFGKGKGGFDKDKMAEIQEEGKKVAEEVKKVLDAELTSDQKKRLKQISVQVMSVAVFAEPREAKTGGKGGFGGGQTEEQKATMKEVADTLKLTDAQKSKVKGLVEEYNKDRASIRTDIFGDTKGTKGAPDPDKTKEFNTKSAKLTTETMGKIAAELDDTQKTAWKGLVGEPFDTTKLAPAPMPKKD